MVGVPLRLEPPFWRSLARPPLGSYRPSGSPCPSHPELAFLDGRRWRRAPTATTGVPPRVSASPSRGAPDATVSSAPRWTLPSTSPQSTRRLLDPTSVSPTRTTPTADPVPDPLKSFQPRPHTRRSRDRWGRYCVPPIHLHYQLGIRDPSVGRLGVGSRPRGGREVGVARHGGWRIATSRRRVEERPTCPS